MKKRTLYFLFIGMNTIIAQSSNPVIKKHQLTLGVLLTPSLSYEVGLSPHTSFGTRLGTGLAIRGGERDTEFGVFMTLDAFYRYYYNIEQHAKKNKRTAHNSANYLSILSSFVAGNPIIGEVTLSDTYYTTVGPVWGFQRTYRSRLNINLELGIGYTFSNRDVGVSPIVEFHLGWLLK